MKTKLVFFIAILLPVFGLAQLKIDAKFNKIDTALQVILWNTSQNNLVVIKNEYNMDDGGSYCKVQFFDDKGVLLNQEWYNYIHENNPRQMIVLHPQQEDFFTFSFSAIKQKIRAYFWIKYSDGKRIEPQFMSSTKEFLLE